MSVIKIPSYIPTKVDGDAQSFLLFDGRYLIPKTFNGDVGVFSSTRQTPKQIIRDNAECMDSTTGIRGSIRDGKFFILLRCVVVNRPEVVS